MAKIAVLLLVLSMLSPNVVGASNIKKGATNTNYPFIVARVALPNQSAPIPLTTILTPKQGKLFRVSFYVDCGGQNLDTIFVLRWTDAIGGQKFSSTTCNSPDNPATGTVTVRDEAGSPLQYEVTIVQGHYDLFFTVERLE
jgi:hypothetical protein